jgi:hypothetical protein
MKMKWCVTGFLMLVLCAGVHLHAEDLKVLKETKAKAEKCNAQAQYNLGQWFADGEQFISEGRKPNIISELRMPLPKDRW